MLPEIGSVEPVHLAQKVGSSGERVGVVAAAGRVRNPAIRQCAGAAHLNDAVLNLCVSLVSLLDRLREARVRHPVEDVPDRLRVILLQHFQDLALKLLDLISGASAALDRAGLISHRAALPWKASSAMSCARFR